MTNARPIINALRAEGRGFTEIARFLNAAKIPTPRQAIYPNARWWHQTVERHINPGPWAEKMRTTYRPAQSRRHQ